MKTIIRIGLVILLLLGKQANAQDDNPADYVTRLVSDLTASAETVASDTDLTANSTRQVLASALDIDRIASAVLGSYGQTLDEYQIRRFRDALAISFESLIARALEAFDDYDLAIGSVRESGARAQVQAIIKPDSGGRYDAVFSLSRSVGGWHAQNLTLNGVNLGLTYRNQFAALMEENANNFEAALADWKREINDGLKGTAPRP